MGKKFRLKIKTINAPITKNGAKGISLFIPCNFFVIISKTPMIAPDQKASTADESTPLIPSKKPSPSASFASPSPIQDPREKSHKRAKGIAMTKLPKN